LLYHPAPTNGDSEDAGNNHRQQQQRGHQQQQRQQKQHEGTPDEAATPITRPTIIFFHGNAGNIGLRIPQAIQMYHRLNVHVWLIEYRGYGDSDDVTPNEMGLKMDAEAVWNHVHAIHSRAMPVSAGGGGGSDGKVVEGEEVVVVGHDGSRGTRRSSSRSALRTIIDPRKMIVFGQSLGGAVAFHLAQYSESRASSSSATSSDNDNTNYISPNNAIYPPLAGIIVENTFLSISKMVDHLMPYFSPIKLFVLRMQWNTEHVVSSIRVPTLFMAGKLDTLVPHFHMLTLYERMKTRMMKGVLVRLHVVENGTHNETWMQGGREYWRAMRQFLEEVFAHEMPEGLAAASGAVLGAVGSNHDRLLSAIGLDGTCSITSVGGRGYGVNDGPFLRKASATTSASAECLPPQPLSGSIMTTSSSTTDTTISRGKDPVEIELGGEDAADMISSVNSILGMAREAATRTVGVAVKGGGGGGGTGADAYKKKD
jgi:pimeloyl-ACP methyl ester carboxylesterase